MRLIKSNINVRAGTGSVTLNPQESEDMWHLYNLIRPGDRLRAAAVRKVKFTAATGSTASETVHTNLTIKVKSLEFDPAASALHVAGQVCEENAYVSMGSHHTLDLELNRNFTLSKEAQDGDDERAKGGWDSVALEMLKEATDTRKSTRTYAVVMQEGLANICAITEFQTLLRQRIEVAIPKKRSGVGAPAHDKGLDRFFQTVLTALLRHMDIPSLMDQDTSTPLLLASPGFIAQEFQRYVIEHAQKTNNKILAQYARDSILVAHASSGHVHSLNEALKSPAVRSKLSDTRYTRDTQLMEHFFELIRKDEGWAWYGHKEVERAVEKGAVGRGGGTLLISNQLFRANNVAERQRWVDLVERVRQKEGGEVRIMSSSHESGKRLEGLGNIGAILTFPLLDLDEGEEEEEEGGIVEIASEDQEGESVNGTTMNERDYAAMAEDMGF